MEVLCLHQVGFVQMPVDSCVGMAVDQFDGQLSLVTIHLFRQMDPRSHRRIDKLHRLETVFSASGFEGGERMILRMMLFIIPLPYGWKGKPVSAGNRFTVSTVFVDTEPFIC